MKALEHRVPPPIVFLIVATAMALGSRFGTPLLANSLTRVVIAGGLFAIAGAIAAPGILAFRRAGTTASPTRIDAASSLVTTGIYRHTRNPMYLGLTLMLLAWAMYLCVPWVTLGPVLFVAFITRFQIRPEERTLTAKFGDPYLQYLQRVRRWL